jgi:hypothetical protein
MAAFQTATLAKGKHLLTVAYGGDTRCATSRPVFSTFLTDRCKVFPPASDFCNRGG